MKHLSLLAMQLLRRVATELSPELAVIIRLALRAGLINMRFFKVFIAILNTKPRPKITASVIEEAAFRSSSLKDAKAYHQLWVRAMGKVLDDIPAEKAHNSVEK